MIYLRGSERDDAGDPLVQLLSAQKALDSPVYIVPMAITYGPRREKKERPLVDIFFGDQEHPGWLRRLIAFIRYKNRTSVFAAEPAELSRMLNETAGGPPSELAAALRGDLIGRIDHETRAALGPRVKAREEIMGMALRDDGLVRFMEEHAAATKKDFPRSGRRRGNIWMRSPPITVRYSSRSGTRCSTGSGTTYTTVWWSTSRG